MDERFQIEPRQIAGDDEPIGIRPQRMPAMIPHRALTVPSDRGRFPHLPDRQGIS
jgi:hypothetical protein